MGMGLSKEEFLISRLVAETPRMWEDCTYDSFTFHAALEYFKRQRPRVLYIALGETDEFAHGGRYDLYLRAAQNADHHLRALWESVQAMPDYRGTTTMIVTTDHGRGNAPVEWKSHGEKIEGSDKIWIAVIGPDTDALGERTSTEPLTQGQVAATVARAPGARLSLIRQEGSPADRQRDRAVGQFRGGRNIDPLELRPKLSDDIGFVSGPIANLGDVGGDVVQRESLAVGVGQQLPRPAPSATRQGPPWALSYCQWRGTGRSTDRPSRSGKTSTPSSVTPVGGATPATAQRVGRTS